MQDARDDFTEAWQGHLKQYRAPTVLKETLLKPYFSSLVSSGTSVLDIGCGTGYFSELLSALGADVVAVDACDSYFPKISLVQYLKMPATELRLPRNNFDLILMINVLSCIAQTGERIRALQNAAVHKRIDGEFYLVFGSSELYDHPLSSDLLNTRKVDDQIEWDVKKTDGSRVVFIDNIVRMADVEEMVAKTSLTICGFHKFHYHGIKQAIYDLYVLM